MHSFYDKQSKALQANPKDRRELKYVLTLEGVQKNIVTICFKFPIAPWDLPEENLSFGDLRWDESKERIYELGFQHGSGSYFGSRWALSKWLHYARLSVSRL